MEQAAGFAVAFKAAHRSKQQPLSALARGVLGKSALCGH